MCGRFTVKMTWAEIVELYKLTLDRPPHNLQPRFNVCPTDPIDVVTERDGRRDFAACGGAWCPRGGRSRSKNCGRRRSSARGNGRRQAVFPRRVHAHALSNPGVRLLRVEEHTWRQAAVLLHARRWTSRSCSLAFGANGRIAQPARR